MNNEDKRIKALEAEKATALNESNATYQSLLDKNQELLTQQNSWQDTYQAQQESLLDKSTALTTTKLEQQKALGEKSFQKEAAASESDYQKFINKYGVNAETQATQGLQRSGYSESTKLGAYNTSRIRTAEARSALTLAVTEFNNQIAEAELSRDTQKATLAAELLQQKLANEMNAFETMSNLTLGKLGATQDIKNTYYNKYQDVYDQQKYEQEKAIEAQRYAEEMAYQKQQDAISNARSWAGINKNNGGEYLTENKTQISTKYYSGPINPDTANGTFGTKDANGVAYQPNNIGGQPLSKTGNTITNNGVKQTIWKTPDGKKWYWEGRINAYVPM